MFNYFLKRILLFIPSILLVAAFTFLLFHRAPSDPVESLLRVEGFEDDVISESIYRKQYKRLSSELRLDLPKFYFSIIPSYYPDTLHRIITKRERKRAIELLSYHNNWNDINQFIIEGKRIVELDKKKDFAKLIDKLLHQIEPKEITSILDSNKPEESFLENSDFITQAKRIGKPERKSIVLPKFVWFGFENQFQSWISNFFSGKLGRSFQDGRPVWQKISKALVWTLFMVLTGLFLTLMISIPIGVWSAYNSDSFLDRALSNFFYFIYAMPLFWLATLMVVFFTTSQYGSWTNIFPGVGISPFGGDSSTLGRILNNSKQLILPIFCIVIHSIAYLSRIVRTSVISESNQQYKITALLKGLTRKSTYRKHLYPNALLPLVTIIIGVIPASLAGSLVLEVIFNIPGIGRLMFDSIFGNDWYVMFSIVMLIGLVTILSYLLGDLLYSYVNPKIRFGSTEKKA